MNIKYLTKRENKLGFPPIQEKEVIEFLGGLQEIAIDTENSGLDAITLTPLLISIGNEEMQIVIDVTTIDCKFLCDIPNLKEKLFIAHNFTYDFKVLLVQGFRMYKGYCSQIVEQSIRMGIKGGNDLQSTKLRRIGKAYETSKDTRNEFIGQTKDMHFMPYHIEYAAEDVADLIAIKEKQVEWTDKLGLTPFLNDVEFNLMIGISLTELEGFSLNIPKWQKLIKRNELKKEELTLAMDNEIRILSDKYLGLKKPIYQRPRKKEKVIYLDLFGRDKVLENTNKGNVNYNADAQIKNIFRACGASIPTKDSGGDKGKETTGKDALANYVVDNPHTDLKTFIDYFVNFQEISKRLSSFGTNYIEAINPLTGKLHTIYRQCGTATGRFASGGGRNQPDKINSQQIPKEKEYRECFCEEEGYNILTIDLSGAELVILASLSGDNYLKTILDDPHSPLATAAYNEVVKYILSTFPESRWMEELTDLLKTEERAKQAIKDRKFTITKSESKDLRDAFKAVIYGLSYGASEKKVAYTLKIPEDYAKLMVNALEKTIPTTFDYLDNASKFGVANGYIELSKRSKNRRWFKDVHDAITYGARPNFSIISSTERECKNSPIQGTQAAMVKESSVAIYKYLEGIDAQILLFVHDELVIKYRKDQPWSDNFPENIKSILCSTCNLYLENGLEMEAEYSVNDTWTK